MRRREYEMQMTWQRRFIGAAVLLCAGLVLAWFLEPGTIPTATGMTMCPFRNLTGMPCPGCGMTRAFHFLVHGDVYSAVEHNPISIILFVSALIEIVNSVVGAVRRGRPLFYWTTWLESTSGKVLSYALVILVFLQGGIRIGTILVHAQSAAEAFSGSVIYNLFR